jgi:hypothetical protein
LLTERMVHAVALERAVVAGASPRAGAAGLAADVADHLRALLRDVICGHLDPDLVGLADELLLAEPQLPHAPAGEPEPELELEDDPGREAALPGLERPAAAPYRAASAVPGTIPFRSAARREAIAAGFAASDAELLGDAGEAEEILDLLI